MFDSAVNTGGNDVQTNHYKTAPSDRTPLHLMLIDGHGAFVNNLFVAAGGSMMIVPNLGLGMNPALVGFLGAPLTAL